jgi:hypothetical protein
LDYSNQKRGKKRLVNGWITTGTKNQMFKPGLDHLPTLETCTWFQSHCKAFPDVPVSGTGFTPGGDVAVKKGVVMSMYITVNMY